MFSRLRNKRAGGRKDRPASRDGAEVKIPQPRGQPSAAIDEGPEEPRRPITSDPKAGVVASAAPILPPIPRIASQVSRSPTSPTLSDLPTIRTVEEQLPRKLYDPSPDERRPDHSSGVDGFEASAMGHELEPVSSIDRAKAELLADKHQMDSMHMPPPSSKTTRPRISIHRPQLRSWTDLQGRAESSKASDISSGQGPPMLHEVPTPYRLDEPKEYITPSLDVDAHSQISQRPRSRLTRLNPLSYLSRKRNSQIAIQGVDNSALQKRASFTPFKDVSESFDPRIIGAGVHDFSTPMPSQYVSVQDLRSLAMEAPPSGIYLDPRRGSDSNLPQRSSGDPSPERRHVPIFKEDFSDSAEGWRLNPEDTRNQVTTDIVDKLAALEEVEKSEKRKSSLPAFAQHIPQEVPSGVNGDLLTTPSQPKVSPRPPTESDLLYTPNSIQQTPDSLKPPRDPHRNGTSPGASPLTDKSAPDTPHTMSSLPRHLRSKTASVKSQASRFSFDMIGSGSAAQEKMLEERHRQRAAQRARATSLTGASINEEDDFDEDDIDFDDDMDEDFPGMGDEDDLGYGKGGGLSNMTLDGPVFSPVQEDYNEDDPEMDDGDEDNDFDTDEVGGGGLGNMTLESFQSKTTEPQAAEAPIRTSRHMPTSSDGSIKGLGLRTDLASTSRDAPVSSPVQNLQREESTKNNSPLRSLKNRVQIDINDLRNDGFYYDDGEFDGEFDNDEVLEDGEAFDEDLLDADFVRGQPLIPSSAEPAEQENIQDSSQPSSRPTSLESEMLANRQSGITADTSRTSLQARRSSAYGQHAEAEGQAGLTQENLAAYHNALAFAANQAAMQGRFERKPSNDGPDRGASTDEQEQQRQLMPPPPPPAFVPGRSNDDYGDDYDDDYGDVGGDFDFDDAMDDEAIIDAANAEALENDDDGFYGQEFGFYAQVNNSVDSQAYHGGYFGPAGMDKVKRSHSGRHDFQEPSLTPITERSEWSNRNSMISLAIQSGFSGIPTGPLSPNSLSVPTGGLAQLADQMQHNGSMDDMSLSALMRARRSAFGGSSTSLHSMGGASGSRSASPNQYMPMQPGLNGGGGSGGYGYPPPSSGAQDGGAPGALQPRPGSALSQSSITNPMLSLQTHNLSLRPTTSSSDSSPLKRSSATRERPGHSRNSSSAESVSYTLERDEDGGNQWFLERRRTFDNGESEVLGREVVQGTL